MGPCRRFNQMISRLRKRFIPCSRHCPRSTPALRTLFILTHTTTVRGFSQNSVKAEVQSGELPDEIDGEERAWVRHSYLTCPLGT